MFLLFSDGDYVELRVNVKYYNDFFVNSQVINGWVIIVSNIIMYGEDLILLRVILLFVSYFGFIILKVIGNEFILDGKLFIIFDDLINRLLYVY